MEAYKRKGLIQEEKIGFDQVEKHIERVKKDLKVAEANFKIDAEAAYINNFMEVEYQNRDPKLETSGKIVGFYEREFYCFSNFSSFAVKWKGRLWPTSEHAYQAAKFLETHPEIAEKIANARSAHEAMKLAKVTHLDKVPSDWDSHKAAVMEDICRHKLDQNLYVRKKLLETSDREIVEDSPKDSFWGWGADRKGRNELGKIWMRIRNEISK